MTDTSSNNSDNIVIDEPNLQRVLKIASSLANEKVNSRVDADRGSALALDLDSIDDDLDVLVRSDDVDIAKPPAPVQPARPTRPVRPAIPQTLQRVKQVQRPQSARPVDNRPVQTRRPQARPRPQPQPQPQKKVERVEETKQTEGSESADVADDTVSTGTGINMVNIFGFRLPKNTLYLIIACLVTAVLLYYITSPKAEKKRVKEEGERSSDEDSDEE